MKKNKGEKVFSVCNTLILSLLAFICAYPIIYVIACSLSSPEYINRGMVWWIPKGFTLDAFKKVFENSGIWVGYANSFFYMIVGTIVNVLLTISGAYPLSRGRLKGRRILNLLVVFTMWFSAGLIPTYLNFRDLGLLNSRFGYIVGLGCSAYNFVLLRTYFESIPDSLEEAAKIDGASDFYTMWRIFVPLAKPSIATIALFYAVNRWNGYLMASILFTDDSKMPLQVLLKKLIVDMSGRAESLSYGVEMTQNFSEESVLYATMVIAIVPMMILYPFVQKYFVKGVMVGSVKG